MKKEENKRMKMRTEERLEVAQAKENYWKLYRGGGKESKMNLDDEREKAWQRLEEEISALEGESSCRGVEENEMIGDEGDNEKNEVKNNCDKDHDDEGVQEENEDRDDDNEMRGDGDENYGMRNEMIGDEGDNEVKKNCDEEHGDEGIQEGDEDRDDDNEMKRMK